jgi:hypothetical protein
LDYLYLYLIGIYCLDTQLIPFIKPCKILHFSSGEICVIHYFRCTLRIMPGEVAALLPIFFVNSVTNNISASQWYGWSHFLDNISLLLLKYFISTSVIKAFFMNYSVYFCLFLYLICHIGKYKSNNPLVVLQKILVVLSINGIKYSIYLSVAH